MLTPDENARYARHYALPGFGPEGQARLRAASVLCIGAGGLGSPALLYLAAAGVGRIGIVDADRVEASNLQRQIIHQTASVGQWKVDSAAAALRGINPHVQVETHRVRLTRENAADLISRYDAVVDGSDNFATRYLSSDVCVWQRKPNVYASIQHFEGQLAVFAPHLGGPCYRCLVPQPPAAGSVPTCAEAGVLGALPGILGSLQAAEALKLLAGLGEPLVGRLLHVDALSMAFREFRLRPDPLCPVCGPQRSILAPVDYDAFCGETCQLSPAAPATDVSAREFLARWVAARRALPVLDTREKWETEIAAFPDEAALLPLASILAGESPPFPQDAPFYIVCKGSQRSQDAARLLRERGWRQAMVILGGMDALADLHDDFLPC